MMRAGLRATALGGLGLRPDQFWALTPADLALMLGIEPLGGKMTRARLEELSALYCGQEGALPPRS